MVDVDFLVVKSNETEWFGYWILRSNHRILSDDIITVKNKEDWSFLSSLENLHESAFASNY